MTTVDPQLAAAYEEHRRYLLGVAYRLLGTVTDAEDAVQEAWLRASNGMAQELRDARAWLTVITTRICIDELRSARHRRERYVGEWLPEPLLDDADPADRVTLDDSVNLALLVVLESLSPAERASFVLHDVFGLPFDEIGRAVGRSPAACRQLASRARAHVAERAPRFDTDPAHHRQVVLAFSRAASAGDLEALVALLDPAAVLRSDGGGQVRARQRPLVGGAAVAAFVMGVMRLRPGTRLSPLAMNGGVGLLAADQEQVLGALGFAIANGRITELDVVMNPDKLAHLGGPA